jgi:hypothetical protein
VCLLPACGCGHMPVVGASTSTNLMFNGWESSSSLLTRESAGSWIALGRKTTDRQGGDKLTMHAGRLACAPPSLSRLRTLERLAVTFTGRSVRCQNPDVSHPMISALSAHSPPSSPRVGICSSNMRCRPHHPEYSERRQPSLHMLYRVCKQPLRPVIAVLRRAVPALYTAAEGCNIIPHIHKWGTWKGQHRSENHRGYCMHKHCAARCMICAVINTGAADRPAIP